MAGASSTPIYRNTSSFKIRSRSNTNTEANQNSTSAGTIAGAKQDQMDPTMDNNMVLRQKSPSPISTQQIDSNGIRSSSSNSSSSSSSNSSNSNGNSNGHSKKSSLSLQPPKSQNHRRSQSFLTQLTNHVRNLSSDTQSNGALFNDGSLNTGVADSPMSKLSAPNSGISGNGNSLSKDLSPAKGKMSPLNSPAGSFLASPVKVSGVAAGPDTNDLILEINDDVDIDSLLHNGALPNGVPKLSGHNTSRRGENLSIRTTLEDSNIGNDNENNNGRSNGISNDPTGNGRVNNNNINSANNNDGSFFRKLNNHYPNLRITISSILLWYTFSMGISVYNRWMFSSENLDFRYPIIITSFHQLILTLLAIGTLVLFPSFRLSTKNYKKIPNKELNLDDSDGGDDLLENNTLSYTMPIKEYIFKIFPCSLASAGDIGLGNVAFRFITLSLYTMVKTSALIFVLLWGVFFRLEKLTLRIFTIVCIMTFGVSMMVWGQHDSSSKVPVTTSTATGTAAIENSADTIANTFNQYPKANQMVKRLYYQIRETGELKSSHIIFIGVTLVLLSACMSGLRWALTQIMLKKNQRTKNPILTMLYISPGMCGILFVVGTVVEGVSNFLNAEIWEVKGVGTTIILILIPGFLAFFMTLSEYVLLQYASLLTLSIAGIFKELLTIFVSWVVFGDELTFINILGLTITFADIVWYNVYRFQQNAELAKNCAGGANGGAGGSSLQSRTIDNEFVDIEMNSININY